MISAPEDAVERLLAEQLAAVQGGDLGAVADLARQVRTLVKTLPPPDAAACRRRLALQQALELALAQQMSDVADRRAQLVRGRRSIKGYRQS